MTTLGNCLVVAGIGMMLISLYLAYVLYTQLPNNGPQFVAQNTNSTSPAGAIGVLVNNLSNTIAQESYIILKIVIFFLVASIGYKFAHLGIDANKAADEVSRKEDEELTKKK